MNRISINSTASEVGAYYFALNPSRLDVNDSDDYQLLRVLDGGQVKQEAYFDSRPIIMSWVKIPPGEISGFGTMINTLYSYKNNVKYINYGDIDYRINPDSSWQKVIIADVESTIEPGGRVFKNITITLIPEP